MPSHGEATVLAFVPALARAVGVEGFFGGVPVPVGRGDRDDVNVAFPGQIGETSGFVGGGEFDDGDGAGLQHVAVALGHRKAPVIYPVGLEYDPIDVIRPGPLLGEFHGRGQGLSVDEEQVGITRFQGIQHFEDCVAVGALIEGGEGYRRAGGQMCLMVGFRPGRGLPRGAGQFGGDPRLFPGLALSFLGGPNPLLFGDPRLFLFPALSFRGGPSPLLFGDPRLFPAFQLLGNPLRDVLRAAIDRARRGAGGALMGGKLRSRNVRLERLRFVPGLPAGRAASRPVPTAVLPGPSPAIPQTLD